MAVKIYHAPLTSPQNSDVWTRWYKTVGDNLVKASTTNNYASNSKIKWILNGINCTVIYHDPNTEDVNDETVNLPYTALMAFEFNGTVYTAGTISITIPASLNYFRLDYIADLNNRG